MLELLLSKNTLTSFIIGLMMRCPSSMFLLFCVSLGILKLGKSDCNLPYPQRNGNALVLRQARLSHLENERTAGTLENAAYTARYNEITKAFLAIVEELEI